jgi:uncharacterized MAPEG superfamily protein
MLDRCPQYLIKESQRPCPIGLHGQKNHYNAIENLASFAALILVANLTSISNNATTTTAVAYFWFRAAHYLFYILAVPFGRSLTFTSRWSAQFCILYPFLSIGS